MCFTSSRRYDLKITIIFIKVTLACFIENWRFICPRAGNELVVGGSKSPGMNTTRIITCQRNTICTKIAVVFWVGRSVVHTDHVVSWGARVGPTRYVWVSITHILHAITIKCAKFAAIDICLSGRKTSWRGGGFVILAPVICHCRCVVNLGCMCTCIYNCRGVSSPNTSPLYSSVFSTY